MTQTGNEQAQPVEETVENKKPETVFRYGAVKGSLFYNEVNNNGQQMKFPNVAIQRVYKDKQGQWQTTNTFGVNDLPKLAAVANKAFEHLVTKQGQ